MINKKLTQNFKKMQNKGRVFHFRDQEIYVGIDVHKKSWKLTASTANSIQRAVVINPPFVENVKKYLNKRYPGGKYIIAYEAGFSGFWAQRELSKFCESSLVIHPPDIPTTDKQKKQKDDKRDSRKISKGLRSGELKGIYIPDEEAERDRSMVRERYNIKKSERRVKNQIKSHLLRLGIDIPEEFNASNWSRGLIAWLNEIQVLHSDNTLYMQLKRLSLMTQLVKEARQELKILTVQDRYRELYKIMESIPGIGLLTAMLAITEIIDMKRFANVDELNSYVGFMPMSHSSGGNERKGKLTTRRNKRLRSALIESAWTAIKNDPELLMKYERYKRRMSGKRAIIRIARILLRRIRYCWLNNVAYKTSE